MSDILAESQYFVCEISKTLVCRLEDGIVLNNEQTIVMLHGHPLTNRINEIIYRVVEAVL
jgi:hypothetical protein